MIEDLPILGAIAFGLLGLFGKVTWFSALAAIAVLLFINYQINKPKG